MVDDGYCSNCLAGLGKLKVVACRERLEFNRLHFDDRQQVLVPFPCFSIKNRGIRH